MDTEQIQQILLRNARLRVGSEMAKYVQSLLESSPKNSPIAVIGGDSRTGVPTRMLILPEQIFNQQTIYI